MEKVIKKLANRWGKSEKIIKVLFNICEYEGKTQEEAIFLINEFYELKVGAN